jgi:hypothetical protein
MKNCNTFVIFDPPFSGAGTFVPGKKFKGALVPAKKQRGINGL